MHAGRKAAICLSALIFASVTQAKESTFALDIPAQPLKGALSTLADQTGLQIVFETDIALGVSTQAVKGDLTAREALQRLLSNTGLDSRFLNDRAIAISPSPTGHARSRKSINSYVHSTGLTQADIEEQRREKDATHVRPSPMTTKSQLEEITVTGSHIRGGANIGSSLMVVTREDIERTGYVTVQDVLRTLPQNFGGGVSEDFSTAQNFNDGTAINLRGLGADATLVLINGRRQPMSGVSGQFVDVSTIPLAAIERIDVLPEGSSAIYGSDAVGGVVNIILRRDYEGAETRLRYGTLGGDADDLQASQLVGGKWSGGSFLLGYQYSQRDALKRTDRDYSSDTDQRRRGGGNYSRTASSPGNILDPATQSPAYAIPAGQDGRSLDAGELLEGQTNLHNDAEGRDLLGWNRQHSAFAFLTWQAGDSVELSTGARYSTRDNFRRFGGDGTVVTVPSTNPYFVDPFGDTASAQVDYNFLRDLGPISGRGESEVTTLNADAKVDLGGTWQANLYTAYGEERTRWVGRNQLDFAGLATTLADPNPETALNVFGGGGNNNPATLDAIRYLQTEGGDTDVWSLGLLADGQLFEMSGGPAALALGLDYREEGLVARATSARPSRLGREAVAVFGELAMPVIGEASGRSGLRKLHLSLSARYENYSDFGDSFNPRVGLTWAPSSLVSLRGTWGKSFKAPNLTDLNESANLDQVFPIPDPQSPTGFSPALLRVGNNAKLKEETADTWTLGFDLLSPYSRNLRLQSTYFNIDYKDRVVQPGPPAITNILLQENIWNSVITRSPPSDVVSAICNGAIFVAGSCEATPPVVLVDLRRRNLSALSVHGFDVRLNYARDTVVGALEFALNGTYLLGFEQTVVNTTPAVDLVGTLQNPLKLRLLGQVSWKKSNWNATANINYADSYRYGSIGSPRDIGSWTTLDLSAGYRYPAPGAPGSIEIALVAINVFDRDPPFVDRPEGYDSANADPLGRMLALQVSKAW